MKKKNLNYDSFEIVRARNFKFDVDFTFKMHICSQNSF